MTMTRAGFLTLAVLGFAAPSAASTSADRDCALRGVVRSDSSGESTSELLVEARYTIRGESHQLTGDYRGLYTVNGRSVETNGQRVEDAGELNGALSAGSWTLDFTYTQAPSGATGAARAIGEGALDGNKLTIKGTYSVVEGDGFDGRFTLKGTCRASRR